MFVARRIITMDSASPMARQAVLSRAANMRKPAHLCTDFDMRMTKRRVLWRRNMQKLLQTLSGALLEQFEYMVYDITCEMQHETWLQDDYERRRFSELKRDRERSSSRRDANIASALQDMKVTSSTTDGPEQQAAADAQLPIKKRGRPKLAKFRPRPTKPPKAQPVQHENLAAAPAGKGEIDWSEEGWVTDDAQEPPARDMPTV